MVEMRSLKSRAVSVDARTRKRWLHVDTSALPQQEHGQREQVIRSEHRCSRLCTRCAMSSSRCGSGPTRLGNNSSESSRIGAGAPKRAASKGCNRSLDGCAATAPAPSRFSSSRTSGSPHLASAGVQRGHHRCGIRPISGRGRAGMTAGRHERSAIGKAHSSTESSRLIRAAPHQP